MTDIRFILDRYNAPDEVKAQAWDNFYGAISEEDFKRRFDSLPLPEDVKADLWDAKFQAQPTPLPSTQELATQALAASGMPPAAPVQAVPVQMQEHVPNMIAPAPPPRNPKTGKIIGPPAVPPPKPAKALSKSDVLSELDRLATAASTRQPNVPLLPEFAPPAPVAMPWQRPAPIPGMEQLGALPPMPGLPIPAMPIEEGPKETLQRLAMEPATKAAGGASFTDLYDMATSNIGDIASKVLGEDKEKLKSDFAGVVFASEMAKSIPELADFAQSPVGVVAALASYFPALRPAVGAAFTVDVGSKIPEAYEQAKREPTPENIAGLLKTVAFAALPALHAGGTEMRNRMAEGKPAIPGIGLGRESGTENRVAPSAEPMVSESQRQSQQELITSQPGREEVIPPTPVPITPAAQEGAARPNAAPLAGLNLPAFDEVQVGKPSGVVLDVPSPDVSAEGRGLFGGEILGEQATPTETQQGRPVGKLSLAAEAGTLQIGKVLQKPDIVPPKFSNPEVQSRWEMAAQTPHPTLRDKLSDTLESVKKLGRLYEEIPTDKYPELQFRLTHFQKTPKIAQAKAIEDVVKITDGLTPGRFEAFKQKVVLDDMKESLAKWQEKSDLSPESMDDFKAAFGLSPREIEEQSAKVDSIAAADSDLQTAIAKRKEVWDTVRSDYEQAMQAAGMDVSDRLQRQDYYRHRVMEYLQDKIRTGAAKLRVPSKAGYLKARSAEAAGLDYSTNYIESEYEVLSHMMADAEKAKLVAFVKNSPENIYEKLKAQAKAETESTGKPTTWEDVVPEGYTAWYPREGTIFYLGQTLPEKLAKEIIEKAGEEVGVNKNDLRQALIKGGRYTPVVIPEEIAKTLDNLAPKQGRNWAEAVSSKTLNAWKQWQLISPPRLVKYFFRNRSGDLDSVIAGNPKILSKVKVAMSDLHDYFYPMFAGDVAQAKMTDSMRDWFERGGFQSTLQAQEISDLKQIKALRDVQGKMGENPKWNPVKSWFQNARLITDWGEATLRYAAYLQYLDEMQANGGHPKSYGASIREQVDALRDPRDRAFKLSNDLMGAYDEVSSGGQYLRKHWAPFWSYQETNFKRLLRLYGNAARDEGFATALGRGVLGKTVMAPYLGVRVGVQTAKLMALWGALQAYNQFIWPDEEKNLPENVRNRPHVVLGHTKEGKTFYFSRMGNIPDLMEWIDPEEAVDSTSKWLNGELTVAQAAGRVLAEGPIEKVVQSAHPLLKVPAETALGVSTYPSLTKPRPIYDRLEYIADHFGLGDVYRLGAGLPTDNKLTMALKSAAYVSDEKEAAYNDITSQKYEWLQDRGAEKPNPFKTERGLALRHMKMAVRKSDSKAFRKYLTRYIVLGGNADNLDESIKRLHPLSGLKEADQKPFLDSLSQDDRDRLSLAEEYWKEVFASGRFGEMFRENVKPAVAAAKEEVRLHPKLLRK